jgi:hypothetical protein
MLTNGKDSYMFILKLLLTLIDMDGHLFVFYD